MRKALLPRVYSPDSLIPDKLDDKSKSGPMSLHKGHSKTSWRPLKRQQVVLVASEQNSIFAKKGSETYIVQETSNYQSVKGRASVRREWQTDKGRLWKRETKDGSRGSRAGIRFLVRGWMHRAGERGWMHGAGAWMSQDPSLNFEFSPISLHNVEPFP